MGTITTHTIVSDPLLSPPQLAELISCKLRTLEFWRNNGKGPRFIRVGKSIRYRVSSVDSWITQQSNQPVNTTGQTNNNAAPLSSGHGNTEDTKQ